MPIEELRKRLGITELKDMIPITDAEIEQIKNLRVKERERVEKANKLQRRLLKPPTVWLFIFQDNILSWSYAQDTRYQSAAKGARNQEAQKEDTYL